MSSCTGWNSILEGSKSRDTVFSGVLPSSAVQYSRLFLRSANTSCGYTQYTYNLLQVSKKSDVWIYHFYLRDYDAVAKLKQHKVAKHANSSTWCCYNNTTSRRLVHLVPVDWTHIKVHNNAIVRHHHFLESSAIVRWPTNEMATGVL